MADLLVKLQQNRSKIHGPVGSVWSNAAERSETECRHGFRSR